MATVLDELLVAIGLETGDLTDGAAGVARDVERELQGISGAGAGTAVGGDFLDALAAALGPGDLDAELRALLDAEAEARAAGQDAGTALADGVTDGAQDGAAGAEQALSGVDAAAAGALVGGLFVAGMSAAMDLATVTGNIRSALSLTEADAAAAGAVAGDVYAAGWGGSLDEVGSAITAIGSSITDVSELTDAELADMSKSALALGATLQADVGEVSTAVGQLVTNGLVADVTEGFDVMTAAAGAFPQSMLADIPATISEYGEHFQRLGLDAGTAFGMMSQFVAAGGRDIDQAADVIHEFSRIAFEEVDRAAGAFRELGLDADEMLGRIHAGGPDAAEALGDTLSALREVSDPAQQAALSVALFGDMAGESSDALLAMDPGTAAATAGLDNVAGAAAAANASFEGSPAAQMDSAMRTLQMTLGTALLPVLQAVSGFLAQNQGLISTLAPIVLMLAAAIGAWVAVQWLINFAMAANPIGAVVLAIALLIGSIVYIATQTEIFQSIWSGAMDGIAAAWDWLYSKLVAGFNFLVDLIVNWSLPGLLIRYWDDITGAVTGAVDGIKGAFGSGIDWVENKAHDLASLPGEIVGYFTGLGSDIARPISSGFRGGMNAVIGAWNGLSFSIPGVDWPGPGSWGGITIGTPNIPYLAAGGITTGPTLAMVGEGREQEAILPLSRLDSMLASVAPAVRGVAGPQRVEVVLDVRGQGDIAELVRRSVRGRGGDPEVVLRGR